jgi:hypothetical protein
MEALVVISDKKRAIHALDLICRGSFLSRQEMKQFLNKVEVMTMRILDQKSPGTRVEKRYLSHKQISQHINNPISYSQDEVDSAKEGSGILVKETGKQIIQESVDDVIGIIDSDHRMSYLQSVAGVGQVESSGSSLVTDAQLNEIAKAARGKWLEVGLELDFEMQELNEYKEREPTNSHLRLLRLLVDWKKKKVNPTVNDLLSACAAAGVGSTATRS